jgi:hypothetical protein
LCLMVCACGWAGAMVSIGVPLEMGTVVKMLALFPSFKTRELLLLKAMRRCQKSNAFLAPFDVKPIILPRQARDKHRETLEKGGFLQARHGCGWLSQSNLGAKNASFFRALDA